MPKGKTDAEGDAKGDAEADADSDADYDADADADADYDAEADAETFEGIVFFGETFFYFLSLWPLRSSSSCNFAFHSRFLPWW